MSHVLIIGAGGVGSKVGVRNEPQQDNHGA